MGILRLAVFSLKQQNHEIIGRSGICNGADAFSGLGKHMNKKTLLSAALVAAVVTPATSMASGYKLNEQSAAGMGTAHAGRAAMAEDASVVFYNPAAMTELDRAQITTGFTYIKGDGEFTGSSVNAAQLPSSYEGYDNGGNYLGEAFIPFFYYVRPINERFSVGLGIFSPFGTSTDYGDNFSGAAFADETSLKSIEIAPTFAYKVNEELSIGGGIDIVYMQGLLSKSVDLIPYNPDPSAPTALQDPANSGFENHFEVSGDDWGYGWNLGAYYKLSDATTLGLTYRSEIEITLEGDSEFADQSALSFYDAASETIVSALSAQVPVINSRPQASEVPLTTPASATLAVTHQVSEALLLQAGTTWTGWSSFKSFDILATENYEAGLGDGIADPSDLAKLGTNYVGHIDESWTDVWAIALGGTYQLNNNLALRAGYAYDQSPVSDDHRTARVPSSDRQWLTFGAGYVVDQNLSIDVAAGYLFMYPMDVNEVNKTVANTQKDAASLTGEYEIDVFALSAQVNYKF